MGFGHPDKTNTSYDDAVRQIILAEREDMWGPIDGEIVAVYPDRQTADVQPFYSKRLNGVPTPVTKLLDVPIEFPRAGGGAVTHPYKVGDRVRLTPQMRDTSNYDETGATFELGSDRSFSLSDMRATITGGDSLKDPLPSFDPDNTHIRANASGTFGMRFSPDGKFKIEGSEGNLYEIIAEFMEIIAADQLLITYGSSAGTGHRLFNQAPLMALAAKVRAMAL